MQAPEPHAQSNAPPGAPPDAAGETPPGSPPGDRRFVWFAASVLVALSASVGAIVQFRAPTVLPLDPPRGIDTWLRPIESGPELGLTRIDGEIRILVADSTLGTVHVAGTRGLLALSRDAGRSWQQATIVDADSAAANPGAAVVETTATATAAPADNRARNPNTSNARQATPAKVPARVAPPPEEQSAPDSAMRKAAGAAAKLAPRSGPMVLAVSPSAEAMSTREGARRVGNAATRATTPRASAAATRRTIRRLLAGDRESGANLGALQVNPDGTAWAAIGEDHVLLTARPGEPWFLHATGSAFDALGRADGNRSASLALGALAGVDRIGVQLPITLVAEDDALAPVGELPRWARTVIHSEDRFWGVSSGGVLDRDIVWSAIFMDRGGEVPLPARLRGVRFFGPARGWAFGDSGATFSTADSGATWQPHPRPVLATLRDACFLDAGTGWLCGDGVVLATVDGGATWSVDSAFAGLRLTSIVFADRRRGYVADDAARVFGTADGGRRWRQLTRGVPDLLELRLVDAHDAWVRERSGRWVVTTDGGRSWLGSVVPAANTPLAAGVARWVAADSIARPLPGTVDAPPEGAWTDSTGRRLARLAMKDSLRVALLGDSTIWIRDGDRPSWQGRALGRGRTLRDVAIDPSGAIVLAGDGDLLLRSADRGSTWRDPREHWRFPAPWFWLALAIAGALLLPALRHPGTRRAPTPSVADLLVSDRPVEPGDPDPLGFESLASAVALFICNQKTRPPLTLAVTGKWGTGKSSLMNLVRGKLRDQGFYPVWFNAWHHQQEDHLLAALLENIRRQAVPPAYRSTGLKFRARLLAIRSRRHAAKLAICLPVVSAALGYMSHDLADQAGKAARALFGAAALLAGTVRQLVGEKEVVIPKAPEDIGSVVSLALALGGIFLTYRNGLRAFGADPSRLAASMSKLVGVKDLQLQASVRDRFATEFREVAAALDQRKMVILIDDLDRCRPANVLQILESINFLVSSGDCVVVMGMDRSWVERCVSIAYKDVADELMDEPARVLRTSCKDCGSALSADQQKTLLEEERRRRRVDFSRRYLEKLINLDIAVPTFEPERLRKVALPDARVAEPRDLRSRARRFRKRHGLAVGLGALLGLTITYGFLAGRFESLRLWMEPPPAPTVVVPVTRATLGAESAPAEGAPKTAPSTERTPEPSPPARLPEPARPAEVRGGDRFAWPWPLTWAAFLVLALLGLAGASRLRLKPELLVDDSEEFTTAINVLAPLIFSRERTPRSAKRFLNKVRFAAMRLRTSRDHAAEGERAGKMPEELLVALSAVEHVHPKWLADDGLYRDFPAFILGKEQEADFDVKDEDFQALYRSWQSIEAFRGTYREVSDPVRGGTDGAEEGTPGPVAADASAARGTPAPPKA